MQNNSQTFSDLVDLTLLKIFRKNKNSLLIGLGANDPKNIFNTTKSVVKYYPKRVYDMPISESAVTGIIIGASLRGLKPIMVHQRLDFALLSFEQIINQAAKWFYMFDGKLPVPILIRMIVGRGWGQGPQHSQSLHSLLSHIPGLKVVMPSVPEMLPNLLEASFNDKNPVIFIEHRWLHNIKLNKRKKNIYYPKLGKAKILKKGKDITIVGCSYAIIYIIRVYDFLLKNNIGAEIIDLVTISPIDRETIINSVNKTKRLLVLDISHKSFGISSEILATIFEKSKKALLSPPVRICYPDIPTPTSHAIAKHFYPNKKRILKTIFKMMNIKTPNLNEFETKDIYQDQPFRDFTGPF